MYVAQIPDKKDKTIRIKELKEEIIAYWVATNSFLQRLER